MSQVRVASDTMIPLDHARLAMIEASLPLGDPPSDGPSAEARYTAEEKRLAIRMILEEGVSYNLASQRMAARFGKPFNRPTLNRWVSDFEARMGRGAEMERRLARGGVKEQADGGQDHAA